MSNVSRHVYSTLHKHLQLVSVQVALDHSKMISRAAASQTAIITKHQLFNFENLLVLGNVNAIGRIFQRIHTGSLVHQLQD